MLLSEHDFAEPALYRLYSLWQSRRRDGALPARADFDPLEMRYMLGNICLIDVLRAPKLRFRYRLVGVNLAARTGADMTGYFVDEFPDPDYRALLLERCHDLTGNPRPLISRKNRVIGRRRYDYEAVWLPLASDGRNVDMLMAGQVYNRRTSR